MRKGWKSKIVCVRRVPCNPPMTRSKNKPGHLTTRYRHLFFSGIVTLFLLSSSAHPDQMNVTNPVLTPDDRSIEGVIEVKTGQSFYIEMRNPASGGYLFKEPEFDKNILEMRDRKSIPPPENSKRAGDFGRMIFIFKAINVGSTEIVFKIYRPWEKDVPAREYRQVNVVVTQ